MVFAIRATSSVQNSPANVHPSPTSTVAPAFVIGDYSKEKDSEYRCYVISICNACDLETNIQLFSLKIYVDNLDF